MKRDATSPDAYRADVSGKQRELLEAIRKIIFEVAPKTNEVIEFGMLSYPGLAHLAAQKNSVNLYVSPEALAKHQGAFSDCGKSCLRFKNLAQLDRAAVRKLLRDAQKG